MCKKRHNSSQLVARSTTEIEVPIFVIYVYWESNVLYEKQIVYHWTGNLIGTITYQLSLCILVIHFRFSRKSTKLRGFEHSTKAMFQPYLESSLMLAWVSSPMAFWKSSTKVNSKLAFLWFNYLPLNFFFMVFRRFIYHQWSKKKFNR